MTKLMTRTMVAVAGLAATAVAGAVSSGAQDFYRGKQITLVISAGPGGGYSAYVLTMTKHMQKHIPGNPEFVRQHRQGAGGLVAANYLYTLAKKDGTVIATVHRGAVSTAPVFGVKRAEFDPRKFSWIGSINRDVSLCVAYHEAPVKNHRDAMTVPLVVGGIGPGSDTDVYPRLFNNVLGTKFKLVTGYPSGTAITLAMERREVQGRCGWSWSSINSTRGDWLRDKKINLLLIGGMSRDPAIPPEIPMVKDLATTDEQRDILELVFAPQEMARPVLGPPGIPADRLQILRDAFDKTMKDPEFLAEAKKRKLDISPMSGKEVEALVASLMAKPKSIVAKANEAISRTDKLEVVVKKQEEIKVETKLDAVKRQGRSLSFKGDGGAAHEVSVSGSRTKVTIGGKQTKRAELKPGMTCAINYAGDKSTAKSVDCK
ncbi:MAG TPA: tripartite tricarboxylate transporter substrate-binding protein [Alphaproteobacteria bacterium]